MSKASTSWEKRSRLLADIHAHKAHVIFLQETHFQTGHVHNLRNRRFSQPYQATCQSSKSKGVSILFSHTPFRLEDMLRDPEGRFLFLKGKIGEAKFTFATIYSPNVGHAEFLEKSCSSFATFTSGTLVLGGDFNIHLLLLLDSLTGSTSIPYKALRRMKSDLISLNFHGE